MASQPTARLLGAWQVSSSWWIALCAGCASCIVFAVPWVPCGFKYACFTCGCGAGRWLEPKVFQCSRLKGSSLRGRKECVCAYILACSHCGRALQVFVCFLSAARFAWPWFLCTPFHFFFILALRCLITALLAFWACVSLPVVAPPACFVAYGMPRMPSRCVTSSCVVVYSCWHPWLSEDLVWSMDLACAFFPSCRSSGCHDLVPGGGVGKWGPLLPDECAASYARIEPMSICVWPVAGCIASDTRGPVVISAAAAGGGVCLHWSEVLWWWWSCALDAVENAFGAGPRVCGSSTL